MLAQRATAIDVMLKKESNDDIKPLFRDVAVTDCNDTSTDSESNKWSLRYELI